MVDYIYGIIIAVSTIVSTLAGVFLTWFLIHLPERKKREKEKKSYLLLLVKEYMDNIFKMALTSGKTEKNKYYHKTLLDTEYLDEELRLQIKIPEPEDPKENDVLRKFLETSREVANTFLEHGTITDGMFKIWMIDYRFLCNVITGTLNIPFTF